MPQIAFSLSKGGPWFCTFAEDEPVVESKSTVGRPPSAQQASS